MGIGKRLRKLRLEKGLTQADLAKSLSLGESTISFYESDKRSPDFATLQRLAEYFQVSTDYLLGRTDDDTRIISTNVGAGKTLSSLKYLNEINKYGLEGKKQLLIALLKDETSGSSILAMKSALDQLQTVTPEDHYVLPKHIPILGTIRAGLPILAEENIDDYLDVPANICADYVLRVTGDSMIGAGILDGDYAICRESDIPQIGQIVVALRDEGSISEATLKFYANGNGNPKLRAANPNYADIDYTDGYRTAGHMVALIRNETPGYHVYKDYITIANYEDWTEVIESAVAAGMKVEHVKEIVSAQIEIAKKFKGID